MAEKPVIRQVIRGRVEFGATRHPIVPPNWVNVAIEEPVKKLNILAGLHRADDCVGDQ